MMTGFLDAFLKEDKTAQAIKTDPLPAGERDTLLLDPALFGDDLDAHDHSGDEKIGSCGNSCGGCTKRGTPACGDH